MAVIHGLSFHSVNCAVFEVVIYRRTYTDVVIRPLDGRTGAVPLKFKRAPTPELVLVPREAYSLSRPVAG